MRYTFKEERFILAHGVSCFIPWSVDPLLLDLWQGGPSWQKCMVEAASYHMVARKQRQRK
jgi:hypothetical protein